MMAELGDLNRGRHEVAEAPCISDILNAILNLELADTGLEQRIAPILPITGDVQKKVAEHCPPGYVEYEFNDSIFYSEFVKYDPKPGSEPWIVRGRYEVQNDKSILGRLREHLNSKLAKLGLDRKLFMPLLLMIDEGLANVMEHGCGNGGSVDYILTPSEFYAEFITRRPEGAETLTEEKIAENFKQAYHNGRRRTEAYKAIKNKDCAGIELKRQGLNKKDGLGIFIIKAHSDEVYVSKETENSPLLKLIVYKNLQKPQQ